LRRRCARPSRRLSREPSPCPEKSLESTKLLNKSVSMQVDDWHRLFSFKFSHIFSRLNLWMSSGSVLLHFVSTACVPPFTRKVGRDIWAWPSCASMLFFFDHHYVESLWSWCRLCLGRLGRSSSSDKSDRVFENIFGAARMRRRIAIEAILSDRSWWMRSVAELLRWFCAAYYGWQGIHIRQFDFMP
jgi:hypothetical protein